jgi:transcription elongation factor
MRGNTICIDNIVRCMDGRFKHKKGVIRHINKNTLFLWDREFATTHGIFVEKTRNVALLGAEYENNNKLGAHIRRDELIDKIVLINGGEWKGYKGRVVTSDDRSYIIEITSKCRKVPIDKKLVSKFVGGEEQKNPEVANSWAVEGGNTPYYPQSPQWGAFECIHIVLILLS